jgi:hypothetical protein
MSTALAQAYRARARHIVERDCHVTATVRAAVYHVITRLADKRAQYWRMARDERRALWLGARDGVRGNLWLYREATRSRGGTGS